MRYFPLFLLAVMIFSGCATPLMKAIYADDLKTAAGLLDKGANVGARLLYKLSGWALASQGKAQVQP